MCLALPPPWLHLPQNILEWSFPRFISQWQFITPWIFYQNPLLKLLFLAPQPYSYENKALSTSVLMLSAHPRVFLGLFTGFPCLSQALSFPHQFCPAHSSRSQSVVLGAASVLPAASPCVNSEPSGLCPSTSRYVQAFPWGVCESNCERSTSLRRKF